MGTTTYVEFTTNLGDIVIALDSAAAPLTVQDFLSYAENMTVGDGYEDSFFHRLAAGFVLQGGGYDDNAGTIAPIVTGPPVQNEFSAANPNVEGTVALAKVGNDPNSGTDQFFINLADNSSNLDSQDGGFTVFGTVTAASWPTVEAIAGLPVVNAGSPFDELPVEGTIANGVVTAANLVLITDVTVTDTLPCYRRGTRIRTTEGEVRVECLKIGDRVISSRGDAIPVRWLGHRRVNCRAHPAAGQVCPVRIAAHAFAGNVPGRDLFLSPDHAVFVDGILVPIKHLINGRTIAQVSVREIEYWHVELPHHDILLAEGLPVESYLDTGNRAAFANGGDHVRLHPDFAPLSWNDACAELVQDGPRLVGVKQRLFERGGSADIQPAPALMVLADGRELIPTIAAPGILRYAVPPCCGALHLLSPSWMPASCHAASLDRRTLGVRLFGVAVDDGAAVLEGALFASGFHPTESTAEGPCRWTNGCARLMPPSDTHTVVLFVEAAATTRDGKVFASFFKKKRFLP